MVDLSAYPAHQPVNPRILLGLKAWDERLFEGVARFGAQHGWSIDCRTRHAGWSRGLSSWSGDGVILDFDLGLLSGGARKLHALSSLPCVNLQSNLKRVGVPVVRPDLCKVGRLAAEHLLFKGYSSLAILAGKGEAFFCLRDGFRQAARPFDVEVEEVSLDALPCFAMEKGEATGVLASDDLTALAAVQLCREKGLSVPDSVGILGVGDRAAFCEFAEVPVSSIDCGSESLGYLAAQRLYRAMLGNAGPIETKLPPLGVSERCSTQLAPGNFERGHCFSRNRHLAAGRAAS